jgi:hypothetical protein
MVFLGLECLSMAFYGFFLEVAFVDGISWIRVLVNGI